MEDISPLQMNFHSQTQASMDDLLGPEFSFDLCFEDDNLESLPPDHEFQDDVSVKGRSFDDAHEHPQRLTKPSASREVPKANREWKQNMNKQLLLKDEEEELGKGDMRQPTRSELAELHARHDEMVAKVQGGKLGWRDFQLAGQQQGRAAKWTTEWMSDSNPEEMLPLAGTRESPEGTPDWTWLFNPRATTSDCLVSSRNPSERTPDSMCDPISKPADVDRQEPGP